MKVQPSGVGIERIFPRQAFRNLTLPIMAVGGDSELYLTYADYNPAPLPGDEDGLQADVKFTKSLDGGSSWSAPVKVNQDTTNADQFQQYVRVTPRGQLNVEFFDRRLDRPDPPRHPGNFFIDTWLARSGDGGATWSDHRISHDSWDPSINPPISPSGEFIGDYQGLVADDCFAIPFVNDTHLANDPSRDPDFDRFGHPRSQFQEQLARAEHLRLRRALPGLPGEPPRRGASRHRSRQGRCGPSRAAGPREPAGADKRLAGGGTAAGRQAPDHLRIPPVAPARTLIGRAAPRRPAGRPLRREVVAGPTTARRRAQLHAREPRRATSDGRPAVRVMSEAGLGTVDGDE
jgi:hypothetical protein